MVQILTSILPQYANINAINACFNASNLLSLSSSSSYKILPIINKLIIKANSIIN